MTVTRLLGRRPPFALMVITGSISTVVLLVFARYCYGLVLPSMRAGLNLSYSQAANLGTATALGYLLMIMVAGVFAVRFGGKQSVLLGLALATIGFVGISQTHTLPVAMALMVLLGMATAFGYTPLISLLSNSFPERRGAVIGFTNSGVGVGMLFVGALVPELTGPQHPDGWRQVWELFAIGGVAVFIMVLLFLRNPSRHEPDSPTGANDTMSDTTTGSVFRNPHVIAVGLVYGVLGLTFIIQATFMYSYALKAGVSIQTAGYLVSIMGLLSIFAGPAWGWLCDWLGHSSGMILSMLLSLLATLFPVLWPVTAAFAAHFVILGLSVSGLFTAVLSASTATVPPRQAAVAVSFVTLFYATGQFIGPAAAGYLIEWSGFRLLFACSCVVLVAGVYLCWLAQRFFQASPALSPCPTD